LPWRGTSARGKRRRHGRGCSSNAAASPSLTMTSTAPTSAPIMPQRTTKTTENP